jgi:predicted metal-dependent HD superfamily phosphohydrolase
MDNKEIVKKAITFAKPYYDLPHRINGYHSWLHIEEGFDLFEKHFNNESSELGTLVFYLSWIFHDIVYIGSSDKNEEESELVFKLFCSLNSDLINEETQKYISEIIIATKYHRPARVSNNEILNISKKLNDIDLILDMNLKAL